MWCTPEEKILDFVIVEADVVIECHFDEEWQRLEFTRYVILVHIDPYDEFLLPDLVKHIAL